MKWRKIRIGSLCRKATTRDPRQQPDTPFRYIDISSIDREQKLIASSTEIIGVEAPGRARQVVLAGDVLVSTVRPNLNAVAMVPPELEGEIASTGFCVLRAVENLILPKFLFYFTRTDTFINALLQHVRGANYPAVTDRNVLSVEIPWPTLSEQRRIVEILDQADALRQQRRAADEKIQRILPALFYRMFGDPLLNPHQWQTMPLGDPRVADINPRADIDGMADDVEVSFVPMTDVDEVWGRIVGTQTRLLTDVRKGFTPFANGDVIFAKITPCMQNGKAAIASKLKNGRAFGSTEFHVLRAGSLTTKEWLYGLVRLDVFRKQAEASFTGTAGQQRVPTTFLRNYEVPVPPLALQEAFANAVKAVLANVSNMNNLQITGIFDNLLHRAFTGELTAKWREAHREEVEAEMQAQAKVLAGPVARPASRGGKRGNP
ncbi:MAG: hypothetical protein GX945_16260 [Lentisphaerae bacterium]|nr:hypothetical protein [Lentisphaerota bacterium]